MQIDFKNAFNLVKRSKVLEAVATILPSNGTFASFCYSQHSHLHFNNTYLSSQSGVQQEDPLGPLLFSLALWPIIKEIKSKLPNLVKQNWCLDDCILAGIRQELSTALNLLTNLVEGSGLELRIKKCELWYLNAIDSRVKRNSKEGLEILGAAIGNPRFVAASLRKRFEKIEKLLDNLPYLDETIHIVHSEFFEAVLVHQRWYIFCDVTLHLTNPLVFCRILTTFREQHLRI